VLMCEFGYEDELMPTIPWLDPAVERGMWWMVKAHVLKTHVLPRYAQGAGVGPPEQAPALHMTPKNTLVEGTEKFRLRAHAERGCFVAKPPRNDP